MTKRIRYDDTSSLGKSNLVPYRKGEEPKPRHDRRLATNLNWKNELTRWAWVNGFRAEIKNEGHHWILKNSPIRVEWWPSSAKLVINQEWDKGIHCHDYKKLINFLEKNNNSTKEEKQE
jgi:hypothetical protein